jgi:oligoribonuclease
MTQDPKNLIWMDLEMTGLDPGRERIIEIATIVTTSQLEVLAEGPVLAIHQSDALLGAMDQWNTEHHNRSGLVARVQKSTCTEARAERETLAFVAQYVPAETAPLCGNSIGQDRRFLRRYMPELERYFHYRNVDVSTVKELCTRWAPELMSGFKKGGSHRALDDIRDSIAELQYYRERFFRLG